MQPVVPTNEPQRVMVLKSYKILDTLPEFAYDDLAELTAQICGCTGGLVTFVDETRQWMKAKYGLPPGLTECPRDITICQTTICNNDLIYVPDLTEDPRFCDSPLVAGDFKLRFYCGMPLITSEGYALGTLCAIDFAPREMTFAQQDAVRRLARQTVAQLELRRKLLERDDVLLELDRARHAADAERQKSEQLLLNILPPTIAEELKANQRVRPRFSDSVTILFADFKNFTRLTETLEPASLLQQLDEYFSVFDEICARWRMEKLKTVGDAYIAVGGLPEANRTHVLDATIAALQIQDQMAKFNRQRERLRLPLWEVRIGINTGPVICGVVGRHKFTYDIWGNTVNVAERMEAAGAAGRVNVSESTWQHLQQRFETEPRGTAEIKGKGPMRMYFIDRIKPEYSADAAGLLPNEQFWRT
jgi:adenylate cyclase